MQQKQKKSESQQKKNSSVAKLMAQRDKNRVQEQKKTAYMELLKAPRSKEYMRLLNKVTEICNQLSGIEKEIERLEQEAAQGEVLLSDESLTDNVRIEVEVVTDEQPSEMSVIDGVYIEAEETRNTAERELQKLKMHFGEPEEEYELSQEEPKPQKPAPRKITWLNELAESTASPKQTSQVHTEPEKKREVSWTQTIKSDAERRAERVKKQEQIKELKRQRDLMAEELRETQKKFQASLPAPAKVLGIIYPDWSRDILMKYGVIACPGSKFETAEELFEIVQPQTEEEEKQWLKGNDAYWDYLSDDLLLVEVYIDAICVIYMDGTVKVV